MKHQFLMLFSLVTLITAALSMTFYSAYTHPNHISNSVQYPERTFQVDRNGNRFLKDGLPFRYISGTIHYFRVHPDSWRDRLRKLKHAGCNVVETYIEWASHEPEPGLYDFEGWMDIFTFMNIAYEEDLLVIIRPGPYIDAERDMGGLPYWLLRKNPNMHLRSSDSSYLYYVDRWFSILFTQLIPFLYTNGGVIIMVQVENEYGSYSACDFYYTAHLRDLTRDILGPDVVLFTTDGDATNYVKCGRISDVYVTVDFGTGTNVTHAFEVQRLFEPTGPLINSEFYPGWLDHWGQPHATRTSEAVAQTLDEMLAMNASVNIYVFHGGTSFGMTAGSNLGDQFMACPTSYDYDAPLNEAGDPTEKYYAIRNITEKYVTLPDGPVPGPSDKYAYGDVTLTATSDIFHLRNLLETRVSKWPLTFEDLSVFNGIVIYSTEIPYMIPDPSRLSLFDIHDRGYVFVEGNLAGIVSREIDFYEIPISAKPNQTLTIVVESQGRICYGDGINDFKGITTNVTINDNPLSNWEMTAVPLLNQTRLRGAIKLLHQKTLNKVPTTRTGGMVFYEGGFDTPIEPDHPQDTFLRLDGWTKGYVWINNFLLGRYWPAVGPQETLYVPRSLLSMEGNVIQVLELEESPCTSPTTCKVTFVDTPQIDGPTPQW